MPTTWADVSRALGLRPPALIPEPVRRRAAVALVLRESQAGLELLFIQRAEHPGDPWSGQMGFPGGRAESHDPGLLETAQRETSEELGLELLRGGVLLGRLDDLRAMSRMRPLDLVISPFVFQLRQPAELRLSREVTDVLWVSLDALLGEQLRGVTDYRHDGALLRLPCFRVSGRVIWGLTYRMFANLQALFEEAASGGALSPARQA
jgi:8-oxo-dGTP pyrophosphatase MutT (NUDIX family)